VKILTGIDLPFIPNCGSIILLNDLYSATGEGTTVRYLGLKSNHSTNWSKINDIKLLPVEKVVTPHEYPDYVNKLSIEIGKHVTKFKPDVIHIQHLSFGMALALSKLSLPKVAICHGTDVQFSQDNNFHANNMIQIYTNSDVVVFPTEEIRKEFYKLTNLKGKDVIVPWGLPDDMYTENFEKKITGKKLLYAGRLDSNKNVKVLIDALKYMDSAVTLTIIGEGDQKNDLEKMVSINSLKERVTFIDFLPRLELWKKFSDYNAFVIPTEKVEAFGLTPVEAQAHGLPVLYSKTNGLIEVLGKSGISFKPNSPEDLAYSIKKLFISDKTYQRYVKLGIENSSKYKISTMRKVLLKLSRDVIRSSINEK
jgi:glycosyltransferase involved in cell wall biosynthesis